MWEQNMETFLELIDLLIGESHLLQAMGKLEMIQKPQVRFEWPDLSKTWIKITI